MNMHYGMVASDALNALHALSPSFSKVLVLRGATGSTSPHNCRLPQLPSPSCTVLRGSAQQHLCYVLVYSHVAQVARGHHRAE